MRLSQLFTQTLRAAPADVEQPGRQWMQRAGYLQPAGAGIAIELPLARLALRRLEATAAALFELNPAAEIHLPAQPVVEALTALAETHLGTYRRLPARLHQHSTAWKEVSRPRGWLNSRYSRTLSVYDFTPGEASSLHQRALALFERCRLDPFSAEVDPGGCTRAVEIHARLQDGPETLLRCPACGYCAAEEAARFTRPAPSGEAPLPLEKVATPHCPTIASLAEFLQVPAARTAKAVFLTAERPQGNQLIFAVVRGDRDVRESELKRLTGAASLRPARDDEIRSVGAVPGYASPVGLRDVQVIVDEEIPVTPNLVSGANEEGYHLLNVNYGRDYTAAVTAQIAAARAGDACPRCAAPLENVESIRLARLDSYAPLPGFTFRDAAGGESDANLDLLEIDLYRVIAACAELQHDERGLRWPFALAPFPIHLVLLAGKTEGPQVAAEELYRQLTQAGCEPLFDDRSESPGVKFNDADLIGLPLRITLGERSLRANTVEFKLRSAGEAYPVELEKAVQTAVDLLQGLA